MLRMGIAGDMGGLLSESCVLVLAVGERGSFVVIAFLGLGHAHANDAAATDYLVALAAGCGSTMCVWQCVCV